MYKGVILDADSLGTDDLDLSLITNLPIDWKIYSASAPPQVAGRIAKADFVVTNKAPIGEVELSAAAGLKLIAVAATGVNVIDLDRARDRGVSVCNCTGYGTASVVQHTFALILALTTHLLDYRRDALGGRWSKSPFFCLMDYPVQELAGKTLGIIGYGELGRGVANIGRAFGMTVKVAALPGRTYDNRTAIQGSPRIPLHELLPQTDVLSLHCPLTPETKKLIGASQLLAMRNNAILINTARGGIVDEQALANALCDGHIGGAGIDVLSEEPPRHGNPLLNPDIPNLIVTPHSAWISRESRQRLVNQLADNIQAFLKGEPQNVV